MFKIQNALWSTLPQLKVGLGTKRADVCRWNAPNNTLSVRPGLSKTTLFDGLTYEQFRDVLLWVYQTCVIAETWRRESGECTVTCPSPYKEKLPDILLDISEKMLEDTTCWTIEILGDALYSLECGFYPSKFFYVSLFDWRTVKNFYEHFVCTQIRDNV